MHSLLRGTTFRNQQPLTFQTHLIPVLFWLRDHRYSFERMHGRSAIGRTVTAPSSKRRQCCVDRSMGNIFRRRRRYAVSKPVSTLPSNESKFVAVELSSITITLSFTCLIPAAFLRQFLLSRNSVQVRSANARKFTKSEFDQAFY